jgi:hypothetical protein
MEPLRSIPLFDVRAQPPSWTDRMTDGEYAVMTADARTGSPCLLDGTPVRDVNAALVYVFANVADAEVWSREQVARLRELRCRIYDTHGLANQPIDIRDPRYEKHDGFGRKTSLWIGVGLFIVGAVLVTVDVLSDWRLLWPSTIGTRLLPAGLLLIVTEGALRLNDWEKRKREGTAR